MKVRLDGRAVKVRAGATVAAVLADDIRRRAEAGEILVADAWGHAVGLGGAVAAGASYFVVGKGARPPSVNDCLSELEAASGGALPRERAKFLVRRAIRVLREAGGGASAGGTAAFALATAARRDPAAMWSFVAGEGYEVAIFDAGKARLLELLPDVRRAVVASRDILELKAGVTTLDYLAGAEIVEVGTTNKVNLADYERRLGAGDAAVTCGLAGFTIKGFVGAPAVEELRTTAAKAGAKLVQIFGGMPLLAASGEPRRIVADAAIFVAPPAAREYDVVFVAAPLAAGGDAAAREKVAAALWDAVS